MVLKNKSKGVILADDVEVASSFFARLVGLLKYTSFSRGRALFFNSANSIHTLFMSYPIDVVFLDRNMRVIYVYFCLRPWRVTRVFWNAKYVIEFACGTLHTADIGSEDYLELI